jgi:CcmD family protein
MDQRNFNYLAFGLMTAWAVVSVYVIFLATRESKIRKELDRLKSQLKKD